MPKTKLKEIDEQVQDLKGTLRQNIEATLNRGDRLDDLEVKAEKLEALAKMFKRNAQKINPKPSLFKCCCPFLFTLFDDYKTKRRVDKRLASRRESRQLLSKQIASQKRWYQSC